MSTSMDPLAFIRRVAFDAARAQFAPRDDSYPRPLGVIGAPHVGDVVAVQRDAAPECAHDSFELELAEHVQSPIDLSFENESCTEHLGTACMLIQCAEMLTNDAQRQQVLEDFKARVRMALVAFQAGRYTPQSSRCGSAS
jgi:hypothetical protein